MATFSNGESGLSVRTKINDVLQHMDGTSGTLVINEAGADVDIRVESDTNTNAIYMDGATGNVGIGTGSPAARLHAQRSDDGDILIARGTSNAQLIAGISSGNLYYDASNGNAVHTFRTNGVERMRITAAGDVGFGTATPTNFGAGYINVTAFASNAAVFEARSGLGPTLRVQADNLLGLIDMNSNHPLVFRTNALERMRISAAGDVGIGTVSYTHLTLPTKRIV